MMRNPAYIIFLYILLSSKAFCSGTGSLEQNIEELKQASEKNLSLEEEKKYASIVRLAVKQGSEANDLESSMSVMLLAQKIRSNIRGHYPQVTDAEYKKKHSCIGCVLFDDQKIPAQEAIDVLIREAALLASPAEIELSILYKYNTERLKRYDPKILGFFKLLSDEGIPWGKLQYGKILLDGLGMPKDESHGIKLLEESNMGEANMALAKHYYALKNTHKFEHYLRLAAQDNDKDALYNLAILEQEKKNYPESAHLLEKVLKIDPEYYEAILELGRAYIEGWGVEQDIDKGLEAMHQVAEKSSNKELREIALENIRRIEEQ